MEFFLDSNDSSKNAAKGLLGARLCLGFIIISIRTYHTWILFCYFALVLRRRAIANTVENIDTVVSLLVSWNCKCNKNQHASSCAELDLKGIRTCIRHYHLHLLLDYH